MENDYAIRLTKVCKSYGRYRALTDISLTLLRTETCLFVGQNGSGKSTLLKLLASLLTPDSGSIETAPYIQTTPVGYTAHEAGFYSSLTVSENLTLFASLLQDPTPVPSLLAAWQLTDISHRKIWELSRGQQARAALARTFLGNPACIILDEPSAYLDDASTDMLCDHLTTLRNRLIIIATHDIGRLSQLSPRVITLHNGEVL